MRKPLFTIAIGLMLVPGLAFAECKVFTSSQLRQIIIQKSIKVGMRAADVERSWGKPTKIRRAYPGGDEWEYWSPAGDQVVTFGANGCVVGWHTHRD